MPSDITSLRGGALLALTLDALDFAPEIVWRVASLIVAVGWVFGFLGAVRRFRRAESPLVFNSLKTLVMGSVVALGISLLLWNVIVPSGPAGGRYAAALALALVIYASRFIYAHFDIDDAGPAV